MPTVFRSFALAAALAFGAAASPPAARDSLASASAVPPQDSLDALASALAHFRGVGYPDVRAYRVTVRLPEDPEEEIVTLQEIWRAPSDLALRAAEPGTPRAIVRGLALYLEPLYMARSSLLGADLEEFAHHIRSTCGIETGADGSARRVTVRFPDPPAADLPGALRDLARLDARLDRFGRLLRLELETTASERVVLECRYDEAGLHLQPELAVWTLPNGEPVEIRTIFRQEGGRLLPATRRVLFPSRYDPGETEEVFLAYGPYELDPDIPDRIFESPDSFRYDANGLVTD